MSIDELFHPLDCWDDGMRPLSDGAREKLLDLLAALGDNPDQIAVSLASRGCVGRTADGTACPVFLYLEDVLGAGDLSVIAVDQGLVAVSEDGGMTAASLGVPEPIADFIDRFDDLNYIELIAPSAGAALAELTITADSETHPYLIQVHRGGRLIAYAIRDAYGWAITARTGRRIRTVARATQRWGVEAALLQYAVTGFVPGGLEVPR
jgi:hypothetical protein